MDAPFTITEKQIAELSAEQQTELLNLLIREEARRLGMRFDQVLTTDAIDVADDAIDAITEAAPVRGEHLPQGDTIWQFKKKRPDWEKLKTDLAKSNTVQELFAKGAGYIYVEGRALVAATLRQHRTKLEPALRSASCTGPVQLMSAKQIADWATSVPAAGFVLRPEIREYSRPSRLLSTPLHADTAYELDAVRRATMEAARVTLFGAGATGSCVRIAGPAGVGKTRLVLELLKDEGMAELALYAPEPPSPELLAWIEANRGVEAIVVIDECTELQASRFEQRAALCGGRVKLVTVVVDSPPPVSGARTFSLNPLDDEAMERVVRSVSSQLTSEQVRWVVQKTKGYVKLARAVALGIARGSIDFNTLRSDEDVRETLAKLVLPDELAQRALTGVSLLTRVGWRDEVAAEAQAVAEFMGMTLDQLKQGVDRARADGLVGVRGRYWYPTPEFLANSLAAQRWSQSPERVEELHERLPPLSRQSFLTRLSQLDIPEVRDVLARLLGDDGPFRDIDSLDTRESAGLFRVLAASAPHAAIERLDSILAGQAPERLQGLVHGRRELVWALEALVARADTFQRAARHLLSLAEAESETYANNATGVWQGIFGTFLGSTEADADARIELAEETLRSDSVARRRLVLMGLGRALESREIGHPLEAGSVPPIRWRPSTWGEVWAYKRSAVSLILRSLEDPSSDIRREAADLAISHARMLADSRLGDEAILVLRRVLDKGLADRRTIWEQARAVLLYEGDALTPEQITLLEELSESIYGESLGDRVQRYTGKWSWVDWPDSPEGPQPENIASSLAEEAFQRPEALGELLPWLVSHQAENVWPFGRKLGEVDTSRHAFEAIRDATFIGESNLLLCSYLYGRAGAGDEKWVADLLDDWASDPLRAETAADATLRMKGSAASTARLFRMIDAGYVPATVLSWTRLGRWLDTVPLSLRIEVVRRLEAVGDDGAEAALGITHNLIQEFDSDHDVKTLAYDLLERTESSGHHTMTAFHWREIAAALLDADPVGIARLVVRLFMSGADKIYDVRLQLLSAALGANPRDVWPVIGSALVDSERAYRLYWEMERLGTVDGVPIDVIRSWLDTAGAKGAQALSAAVKPAPGRNDDLLDLLLTRFPAAGGTLYANYWSGGYTGPQSRRLEELIEGAGAWVEGPSDSVRKWAQEAMEDLKKQLPAARLEDDEWDFLAGEN